MCALKLTKTVSESNEILIFRQGELIPILSVQVYDDLNPLEVCLSYDTLWNDGEKLVKFNTQQLVAAVKNHCSVHW